ncbi:MAG: glycoside hydrolase, end-alpha-1,4-polygalactosaminidase [Actinobacteria bacterium]|nr:MAG: glycoside hydrolase, end-alpha-1,4-polygalactosaminidase [Actinomycetota bacterium]
MYQIQDLDREGAIQALEKTDYPLLVLEPTNTSKGSEDFDLLKMIKKLRKTPDGKRRLLLAYIDIGEAEDYRTYWKESWQAPTESKRGKPDFIITADPDGWSGNYPVAYWDERWKDIWLGEDGLIRDLAEAGFDGIYLDWVEAYDDEKVIEAAQEDGLKPAKEMINFIKELKESGRQVVPDFLVVAQNAPYLLDEDPKYSKVIDALAMEDTWFQGEADADWDDPAGGDIKNYYKDGWTTDALLEQYKKYSSAGLPVFSVDYCLKKENAEMVYRQAKKHGLRPLVTRVSLSKQTTTPSK